MKHLKLLFLLISFALTIQGIYLSNLNSTCFRCLCEASTGCSNRLRCDQGYCGPFSISRAYWIDAGKVVKAQDDPNRWGSYEECANNYDCATDIITQYMEKYGKDCNNDGLVDCVDYAMLHINGGPTCHLPLNLEFSRKFNNCLLQNRRLRVANGARSGGRMLRWK
ncbi:AAEL001485-PA [Aedes aegypti]|uniref:lysozyme n=2 Tax=Aedes aegypti TaxID=7159 RepID=A0A1S4EYV9_AEDAE|nr:lysozyme 2 [Aedes aegypti]EAT47407.1 AAEL001485-PA [Aedes aegypti]